LTKHKTAGEMLNLVVNIANGTIELTHPISDDDVTRAAELAHKMGGRTTTANKTYAECIEPYMSERSITVKSRGEARSILEQYEAWASAEKLDPWQRSTAVRYRSELQARLHGKTANKHLSRLSSIGAWATRLDYIAKNPFDGLALPKPEVKASDERAALSRQEVSTLLASLTPATDSKHWWPLLALYTAARPNELAQLYTTDIVVDDGITCISINDSKPGQRLKNVQSKRLIPVHSELVRWGFPTWVEGLRSGARLFPTWSMGSKNGAWQGGNSWYKRHRDSIGLEKDGYCLRHTTITCLRDLRQPPDLLAELAGHKRRGITLSTYSKDSSAQIVQQVVEAIPVNPGRA
jgi:hypothetical protein